MPEVSGIATTPRVIGRDEEETVSNTLKLFSALVTERNIFAGQWEEAAILLDVTSRNTFFYGSYNLPGEKKTQQQVDSTGMMALSQFCAIADSLVTPKNQKWHGIGGDDYLMKQRGVRLWCDSARDVLFRERYKTSANFHGQNYANWKSLGAYGNSVMFTDGFDNRHFPGTNGPRYCGVPLGECFFAQNHQGLVDTIVRWFRLTAPQILQKFGPDWFPSHMKPALDQNLQTPFEFLHCVKPRHPDEYDPERLDEKGMPFESYYVSIQAKCLMAPESGYHVFPYAVSRYEQAPREVYGRGPAQLVLPGLKTLNAQKSVFLKQGHRASDPVLITADDGLIDVNMRPGALNKGGIGPGGEKLVDILPTGNIQIAKEMMDVEAAIIENMFLTSLFKTLTQHPDMTATQVIELLNERGMLVAPTLGRQHNEYVGGMVPRELFLLSQMRDRQGRPMLPPMPPVLQEAGGLSALEVVDTSPLAMAARANEAAGLFRTVEFLKQIANDTQDPSVMDVIDMDVAGPEVAQINGVPARWCADEKKIAAKRKARDEQRQQEMQIQSAPAQAAMMKATAAQVKVGMQPGQPVGAPQGV